MGAKNKLLSRGALIEEAMKTEEVKAVVDVQTVLNPPVLLHHATKPSQVVKTKEEFEKLIADGYADHPGKVKKLPGWEHLYVEPEKEEEKEEEKPEESKGSIFDSKS